MIKVTHVLCPVDFSPFSARALAHAAALARWYNARLTALHVWTDLVGFDVIPSLREHAAGLGAPSEDMRQTLEQELRRFSERNAGVFPVTTVLSDAPNVEKEVVSQIAASHADLLVIGSHGRSGFERMLLGSVAEKLVRRAPCPVMVVPAHDDTPPGEVRFKRIVCPVDFSASSCHALEFALSLVEEADGHLSLATVLEIPPELQEVPTRDGIDVPRVRAEAAAKALARLRALIPPEAHAYCSIETDVLDGKAYREILRLAGDRGVDLIVMGVSGHGALDRWVFGSNTASVIRGSRCPVLIVRDRSDV